MASAWRVRTPGSVGAGYSKNAVRRTCSTEDKSLPTPALEDQRCLGPPEVKADQLHKPTEAYDFSDNSDVSSMGELSENEKDEEPYESFEPPLHSTAIYTDEVELSRHCKSFISSTPQGKETKRSSNTSEIEESEDEFVKISAKKPAREPRPISEESESCSEGEVITEGEPAEQMSDQQHEATSSSDCSEKSAGLGPPQKRGPLSARSSVEKETLGTESQPKTQKKEMFHDKRKKSRNEARDSDTSDYAHIWCLKGKRSSDVMELDVVLSALEKNIPEYKQNVESKICKEAINKFHSSLKEELIKTLIEVQKLKTLKRKNAKMTSDVEKKRQRLIEVQNELLWLEPQLKQLQIKYDELKERKSSLRNAAYFLSNLKQLHQDYSDVREREPHVKETYESRSLPALLVKGRTLLGAQSHLQSINHQLERLLDQE